MSGADVQLEHGHVRIANRLYEAMLDADFTPTQFKLLHGLIRLSYGWSRKTVSISQGELAAAVNMKASGAFRSALRELIRHGVIIVLEQGIGHTTSTLAIQKDFTKWGRWATHPDRLKERYGQRPEHNDELLAERLSESMPSAPSAQVEAVRVPTGGQSEGSKVGIPSGSNSAPDDGLEARKAIDSQGQPEERAPHAREDWVDPKREPSPHVAAMLGEQLTALIGQHADDVMRFLDSRLEHTRPQWRREMLKIIGPGSPYTPADLAGACADSLAVDKPIGGPGPLRAFVESRRRERTKPADQPPSGGRPFPVGAWLSVSDGLVDKIIALVKRQEKHGGGYAYFIRRESVTELGEAAARAYERMGGPDRFIAAHQEAAKIPFLKRDFATVFADAVKATNPAPQTREAASG